MKKTIPTLLRSLLCSGALLLTSISSFASHIFGAELRYKWISGFTYEITVYLYGDCGSSSAAAFSTLPTSAPEVCIFNGSTSIAHLSLPIQPPDTGAIDSVVCTDSLAYTTCTNLSYTIPGIKKFIYSNTYTLPGSSQNWVLVYNGGNGSGSAAGRTAAITNLYDPGSTIMQLIDTLNTTTSRGHNSSVVLTVDPMPFFCGYYMDCYNPGANDDGDTSTVYGEPHGDSLVFSLITPTNGTGSTTCTIGSACTYVPGMDAWTTPTIQPVDGAHPVQCTDGSTFSFDAANGQICFKPFSQRSTVVYNIDEYFHDTLTGTLQREMNFSVVVCDSFPCSGLSSTLKAQAPVNQQITEVYPNPTSTELSISASYKIANVTITNFLGQTVFSHEYDTQKAEVDVADLPGGIYFVKVNGQEIRKFVKE